MHKLALIIPTRNRFRMLSTLLESLEGQTVRPHQVIVVDGSDEPMEDRLRGRFALDLTYVRVFPPGLTRQRNAGIRAVRDGMTLVGYLDDDIVADREAVETLCRFWESADAATGGVSFNITNAEAPAPSTLARLFLLDSRRQGRILRSGFATAVSPTEAATPVEWLCGGATVWRREIVDRFHYDEWFAGTAYFEDIDFSYRASQTHRLFVLRDARVEHHPPPFDPRKMRFVGEMRVTYRYYFVRKHFGSAFPAFYWSTFGLLASNFLSAVLRRDRASFHSTIGTIIGIAKVLTGRAGGIHADFRKTESQLSKET